MSVKELKTYSDQSMLDINTIDAKVGAFDLLVEYKTFSTVVATGTLTAAELQGGIVIGAGAAGLFISSLESAADMQATLNMRPGQCVQVLLVSQSAFAWDITITDTANMTFNNSVAVTKSVPAGSQKVLYIKYTGDGVSVDTFQLFM